MSPYAKDLNTFVDAANTLLSPDFTAADLTAQENQVVQYYLAALGEKFPALTK